MQPVTIHTDGACSGNPGPGGWGAVVRIGDHVQELSGGAPVTTNNRMELQAAIAALESLSQPGTVELFTDSVYVRDGITRWLVNWKRNGWRTVTRQAVKNADLWQQLEAAAHSQRITWKWLKGHAGHPDNERCDELARAAIDSIRKQPASVPSASLAAPPVQSELHL